MAKNAMVRLKQISNINIKMPWLFHGSAMARYRLMSKEERDGGNIWRHRFRYLALSPFKLGFDSFFWVSIQIIIIEDQEWPRVTLLCLCFKCCYMSWNIHKIITIFQFIFGPQLKNYWKLNYIQFLYPSQLIYCCLWAFVSYLLMVSNFNLFVNNESRSKTKTQQKLSKLESNKWNQFFIEIKIEVYMK